MEEDLTTGLHVLESHLGSMLERVDQNSQTLRRFQAFEMKVLNLNSLSELIDHLFGEVARLFSLDLVSFSLVDEKGEIIKYLKEDNFNPNQYPGLIFFEDDEFLKFVCGLSGTPLIGSYESSKYNELFAHAEIEPESVAIIPLVRRKNYLGSLNLGSYQQERFMGGMATDFVDHMASVISVCLENYLNFEVLKRSSLFDTLTGVNNRRFLEQRFVEEIDRVQRSGDFLACFFLDIDHFKSINDNHGHQAGDEVLATVAKSIRQQLRNNDVLARYGGEEFVALLGNINEKKAIEIAERIRQTIFDLAIDCGGNQVKISISIGMSLYYPGNAQLTVSKEIASRMLASADASLYKAKTKGRNCVVSAGILGDLPNRASV
ncbi:MAG: sensor domain-containing diguanylate cyclase [Methylococcaceae bacterium]